MLQNSLGSLRQYAIVYINLALASNVMYDAEACGIQNTIAIEDTVRLQFTAPIFNVEDLHAA